MSLANPTVMKMKKTPIRKRRNDPGGRVFQKDVALLIENTASRWRILPQQLESAAAFSLEVE
jgi:hypothetical protein